jgi:hypothetical protein
VPLISGNSAGLVALGKFLIQIGLSEYKNGYHVHIYEDFNADKPEIIVIGINNSNRPTTIDHMLVTRTLTSRYPKQYS